MIAQKNSLDVAFKNAINDLNQAIGLTTTLAGLMQSVADNLNYYNNNVGDSSRMPKLIKLQQDLNNELKDGQRWYETDSVFQARRAQAAVQLEADRGGNSPTFEQRLRRTQEATSLMRRRPKAMMPQPRSWFKTLNAVLRWPNLKARREPSFRPNMMLMMPV
ncbi:hypothetical protein LNP25_15340 [Klebsiella variicola subsp. variicola]|nr:hypothetical protein [Klebsiella variicola subsp. variicola]